MIVESGRDWKFESDCDSSKRQIPQEGILVCNLREI